MNETLPEFRGEARQRSAPAHLANARPDDRATNHPIIGAHLENFHRDVKLALKMIDSQRPNGFLLGSVTGSCPGCHAGSS
jgi:hypothetical protein